MARIVEVSATASRQIESLDPQHAARIVKFIQQRLAKLNSPRDVGKALQGSHLGDFWKYRVGNYRLICKIEDARLIVLVLQVGHRKEIYR